MFLFVLLLSASVIWLVNTYVVRETVELTEYAVKVHFAKLPQLQNVYNTQQATSGTTGTSDYGDTNYGDTSTREKHIDLYNILDTNFYQLEGNNLFSYDSTKVGSAATKLEQEMNIPLSDK